MKTRTWVMTGTLAVLMVAVAGSAGLFAGAAQPTLAAGDVIPGHYIVILRDGVDSQQAADDLARQHGLALGHVYRSALRGFSAKVPAARLEKLRADPRVLLVDPDRVVAIEHHCVPGNSRHNNCATPTATPSGPTSTPTTAPLGQVIPTGIQRIHGPSSSAVAGDGAGSVPVDVAVVDTGIAAHNDLNIVGGYNCQAGSVSNYSDGNGHGTHVAGTIGARDNNLGVVGVAPGARMWAVRVLNNSGSGSWSTVICGLDWVTARASTIEVANLSLGGTGLDGECGSSSLHLAICRAVNAGVTVVVAAGNSAANTAGYVPATYDEAITVSALADFDGLSGGSGSPTCRADTDDTFANFSNFGADVDLIAPGVCILSTWTGGGYNTISGTSMASPHVAGAAALYLSQHPGTLPAQVKAALQAAGTFDWDASDDPDGVQERLLDVSDF